MTLYINTTQGDRVKIAIKFGKRVVIEKKFIAKYKQAERLLPEIEKLLKSQKLSLSKIKKIKVINLGGSFTGLRVGVVTANALAYALGIPVTGTKGKTNVVQDKSGKKISLVQAYYAQPVSITKKEKHF